MCGESKRAFVFSFRDLLWMLSSWLKFLKHHAICCVGPSDCRAKLLSSGNVLARDKVSGALDCS